MENNENTAKTVKSATLQGDLRTFCIALLTTVIVLALYHFGTGVYAIFCGTANYGCMPVTREYVLVPVMALPQQGPDMHRMHRGGFRGPHNGAFRHGKRGEMPPSPDMQCKGPGEMPPAPDMKGKGPGEMPPAPDMKGKGPGEMPPPPEK